MSLLTYTIATEHDLPQIVDIYNETIGSRMVTADLVQVSVESKLAWFAAHNAEKRPLWVVQNGGKTIGWASFQSFYGRPAYDATVEVSIYISEAARGQGFGKEILQYCIDAAPGYNIKTLLGFIFSHNKPSIMLFKKFGFETWGLFPEVAELDGVKRSLEILGKRLVS